MDFMNRGVRPGQPQTESGEPAPHHAAKPAGSKSKFKMGNGWSKAGFLTFAVSIAILIVAVIGFMTLSNENSQEEQNVDKSKFQAVFLNGGQVYFGKIGELNNKFMEVANIYYLRVNQQVQPGQTNASNDVSLVKLGCELHGPQDSMVINREQVIFWENLKGDGQVAKAIDEYVKTNPNGQKCEDASKAQNNSSTTPPATTPPATTKPTTPTTPSTTR